MISECYNKLGNFCLKKKADCDSDLFHCELTRNYVLEHTLKREESHRIEYGIGACDSSVIERLYDKK